MGMTAEKEVAGHYGQGGLEGRILGALTRAGLNLESLTPEQTGPIDEFHVGGLEATKELATQMELRPGMRLLDVGSGIGGPARYFASQGCQVQGIDLTKEFVEVAKTLTKMMKLDSLATFQQASALELPFADESLDGAYLIHVGMNLADKAGVFREVRRVVAKGGLFTIFDFVKSGDGAFSFPVPWARGAEASFVGSKGEYRNGLRDAGFQLEKERSRAEFSIEFTKRAMARMAEAAGAGAPPLGLHLLMGEKTPEMLKNIMRAMQEGVLEPVEQIARAV